RRESFQGAWCRGQGQRAGKGSGARASYLHPHPYPLTPPLPKAHSQRAPRRATAHRRQRRQRHHQHRLTTDSAAPAAPPPPPRHRRRAGPTERSAEQRSPTTREHHGASRDLQEVPPPRRLGRAPPVPTPEPDHDPPAAAAPQPPQPSQSPDAVEAPPPAVFAAAVVAAVAAAIFADAASLALSPEAALPAGSAEAALALTDGQEAARHVHWCCRGSLQAPNFRVAVLYGPPAEGLAAPPRLLLHRGGANPSAGAVRSSQGQEGLPDAAPQTALTLSESSGAAPSRSLASHWPQEALAYSLHEAPTQRVEDFGLQEEESIIFIRDRNAHGQELSGYIDYAHRLKMEDFEVYFTGKRKLLPRPTDLSFYNWDSHVAILNPSPNYQVIAENCDGLLFKYKRDRKIINVDPKVHPGDNSTRTPIQTDLYLQVVIYDHVSRRKT
uniref:Cilia- and flagella-associated protein 299 n=1 Tax=Monodelphis domestica TaxID=13616 RepID=A0A5F8GU14_MONDO